MNFLSKFRISLPLRIKRMEKLETLQLAPAQCLHLIRVDGLDYLVLLSGGHPAILPTYKEQPLAVPSTIREFA